VNITMKRKPLKMGQTVKIKPQVKGYGGQPGTVVCEGRQLGWRVVKVPELDLENAHYGLFQGIGDIDFA